MQPILYLFMGYPGSGKTSAAIQIAQLTGASHLWADEIRRLEFTYPTYSHDENIQLYTKMNAETSKLLRSGKSVVFDTAFNFYKDREHLRTIASESNAKSVLLWLQVDRQLAKNRALDETEDLIRPVGNDMTEADFERMAGSLEPPHEDEQYIALDGTKITKDYIASKLQLDAAT